MPKKRFTTEEFIEKTKKVHGDLYDYSKVDYIGCGTIVTIICKIHGDFKQLPHKHLVGHGCSTCGRNKPRR